MKREIELYAKCPCLVAEGPRWCAAETSLYWVDVTAGHVYVKRDGDAPDAFETFELGLGKIGAAAVIGPRRLLLFANECKVWEYELGGTPRLRFTLPGHANTRFNDVFTDGVRYYCGVAPAPDDATRRGELWMMTADGAFSCIEPATRGMPNGMGFAPDGRTFYFIVTDERRIYAYDYDRADGMVGNRRVLCETDGRGMPDGMCVAPDGTLWIGFWDGYRLERRAADGKLLESIAFPMAKVSSVEALEDRLFVTTANLPHDERAFADISAGCVFEIH